MRPSGTSPNEPQLQLSQPHTEVSGTSPRLSSTHIIGVSSEAWKPSGRQEGSLALVYAASAIR
jgi:hypothetical protein